MHVMLLTSIHILQGTIENIRQRLQSKLGKRPLLTTKEFENWGQTVTADVIYCEPKTKKEIQRIIQIAADEKMTVRCVGSSHSWAPVICDDNQILMNFSHLQSDYGLGGKIRISNVNHTLFV
jgi:FAD/FMN-containing dehydrogenase